MSEPSLPAVVVAVPLRDEAPRLPGLLAALAAQSYPPGRLRIFLVDGGSTDGTRALAQDAAAQDARITLLDNPRGLAAAGLNLALAQAEADFFVRLDARTRPDGDYIARCIARLQEGVWAGVAGPQLAAGETPAGQVHALALNHALGVGAPRYRRALHPQESETIYLGAYQTAWLRRVAGWDEAFAANEDYELNTRLRQAGARLLVDPEIRSLYIARDSLAGLWRQYARYGAWRPRTWRRHPQAMRPRHLAPALLVAALIAAVLLTPFTRWPLALLLAAYLLPLAIVSVWQCWRHRQCWRRRQWPDPRCCLRLFAAFLVLHLAWGLGFWRGVGGVEIGRLVNW